MRRQREWEAHAGFMDALAAEGTIVAGGPLGSEDDAPRVLQIMQAENAGAIEAVLAQDPWTAMGLLRTISIEPWRVLLGRLDR